MELERIRKILLKWLSGEDSKYLSARELFDGAINMARKSLKDDPYLIYDMIRFKHKEIIMKKLLIGLSLLTSIPSYSGEVCRVEFLEGTNLQVVLSEDGKQLSHPEAFTERTVTDLRELKAEGICK